MLDQETINSITSKPSFTDNQYHVTEDGSVNSITVTRFKNNPNIIKSTKTELLIGDINFGYRRVQINGKHERVHRLVAHLYCENPHNYYVVNHKDGDKLNNHYTNLEWCTAEHNEKHSLDTGLKPKGESHYLSTFTEAQLRECLSHPDFKPLMSLKDFKAIVTPLNCTLAQTKSLLYGNSWLSVTKDYGIVKRDELEDRPDPDKSRKLTKEQVLEIHEHLFAGKSDTEIGNLFNVSNVMIKNIRTGAMWNELKPEREFPEANGRQAINVNVLKQIQNKLHNGYTLPQVVNEFNISKSLASQIKRNKLPKYLQVA
jgi:hypothetical protein